MPNDPSRVLRPDEMTELKGLVERYEALPEAPTAGIAEGLVRLEALLDVAYQRRRAQGAAESSEASGEERELLDRAESLVPLLKVCMPGDRSAGAG